MEHRFEHKTHKTLYTRWGETEVDTMHGKNRGRTGKQAHFGYLDAHGWCHGSALV